MQNLVRATAGTGIPRISTDSLDHHETSNHPSLPLLDHGSLLSELPPEVRTRNRAPLLQHLALAPPQFLMLWQAGRGAALGGPRLANPFSKLTKQSPLKHDDYTIQLARLQLAFEMEKPYSAVSGASRKPEGDLQSGSHCGPSGWRRPIPFVHGTEHSGSKYFGEQRRADV